MITNDTKVIPDIKIRGLICKADVVPSQYINVTQGLLTVGAPQNESQLYVAESDDQISITPAPARQNKLSIVQIDDSGNLSVLDGTPTAAYEPGISVSGATPVQLTTGGNMNILIDEDFFMTYADLATQQCTGMIFDGTNMWSPNSDSSISMVTPSGVVTNYPGLPYTPYYGGGAYDNAGHVWVIAQDGSNNQYLTLVNIADGSVFASYGPYGVTGDQIRALTFDGTYMWAASEGPSVTGLTQINASTGAVVATYSAVVGSYPLSGVTQSVVYDGTNVWLTDNSGDIAQFNISTTTMTTFQLAYGASGLYMAYDGVGSIWLPAGYTTNAYLIQVNTTTGASTPYVLGGQFDFAYGFIVADTSGNLWISDQDESITKFVIATQAYTQYQGVFQGPYQFMAFNGTDVWAAVESGPPGTFVKITPDFQTITLGADGTAAAIAADIQTQVQALTPVNPANSGSYTGFTATWDGTEYTLTSGNPGGPTSKVTVTSAATADVAASLELGVANGGTETAGTTFVTPSYPAPAAGNRLLAYLFKPGVSINSSTTVVTNADIDNTVPER